MFVKSIDAPASCPDCTAIQYLCLNNGEKLRREDAYWRVRAGADIRSGSESGPRLQHEERDGTRYVRTAPNDTPYDNLLSLSRTC